MGITNTGKKACANKLSGVSAPADFTYLAVGTSSTAFDATQTALVSEITTDGLARALVTPTIETTTVTDDTMKLSKQWSVTGAQTVRESGVLNAASAGILFARNVLATAQALDNGDTFTYNYSIIFA